MKILITSGPTREPIDSVRYITNMSSGKTGRVLAQSFFDQGHEVFFLHGVGSAQPERVTKIIPFLSFEDLNSSLKNIMREERFDLVIHLAAVSDYSVERVTDERGVVLASQGDKIESNGEKITVLMKRNPKILNLLKSYAFKGSSPFVIGFKLTDSPHEATRMAAVRKIYDAGGVDLIVHNDLRDIKKDKHAFRIIEGYSKVTEFGSAQELAGGITEAIRRVK